MGWIEGYVIPLDKQVTEFTEISEQINLLLKKGAINRYETSEGEFISPIFLRPKPDGSNRLILNLKSLNENIRIDHFKFEDLRTAKDLLRKNSYMATIDLKTHIMQCQLQSLVGSIFDSHLTVTYTNFRVFHSD